MELSINNLLGVRSSQLLLNYGKYDERVFELGREVKRWAITPLFRMEPKRRALSRAGHSHEQDNLERGWRMEWQPFHDARAPATLPRCARQIPCA